MRNGRGNSQITKVAPGVGVVAQPGGVEIRWPGQPGVWLDQARMEELLHQLIQARKQAFPQVGRFDFIDVRDVL